MAKSSADFTTRPRERFPGRDWEEGGGGKREERRKGELGGEELQFQILGESRKQERLQGRRGKCPNYWTPPLPRHLCANTKIQSSGHPPWAQRDWERQGPSKNHPRTRVSCAVLNPSCVAILCPFIFTSPWCSIHSSFRLDRRPGATRVK